MEDLTQTITAAAVESGTTNALVLKEIQFEMVTVNIIEEMQQEQNVIFASLSDNIEEVNIEVVKEARKRPKSLRIAIEKRRKERKEDSLEYGRMVDKLAKEASNPVEEIEGNYDRIITAYDAHYAKKKIEAERLDAIRKEGIQNRLNIFRRISYSSNSTAAELHEIINMMENLKAENFDYGEFFEEFSHMYNDKISSLQISYKERAEFERKQAEVEAERVRMAEEKANAEKETKRVETIKNRLHEIMLYPLELNGKPWEECIKLLKTFEDNFARSENYDYQEFAQQASQAIIATLATLKVTVAAAYQKKTDDAAEAARAKVEEERQVNLENTKNDEPELPLENKPVVVEVDMPLKQASGARHFGTTSQYRNTATSQPLNVSFAGTFIGADMAAPGTESQSIGGHERTPEPVQESILEPHFTRDDTITITRGDYYDLRLSYESHKGMTEKEKADLKAKLSKEIFW